MNKSRILVFLFLAFLLGVFLKSVIQVPQSFWLVFLFLSAFLICLGFFDKRLTLLGLIFLFFGLGILRMEFFIMQKNSDNLSLYYTQEITLTGIVTEEVEKRVDQQKIVLEAERIKANKWQTTKGRLLISANLYPKYSYGDKLQIKGVLKKPVIFEDFNYREYLAKEGIYSVIYYPEIKILSRNQGNWFLNTVFKIKNKARQTIEATLLPPQSSVAKAVSLGDRFGLSEEFKQKLNQSGTRHIVAISGLHIVLVLGFLFYLALGLGLWRDYAFYLVLLFLFLYVIFIGAPASAVRASLMGALLLWSQKLGRLRSADRALLIIAALMVLIKPSLLVFDVGFQLSFTATLGIIYLKPMIDQKIEKWSNPFNLRDILTMTLAAQIGVLGLLIFHFGRFSLISPLANIFIVPVLPLVMISSLILLVLGGFYLILAKFFAFVPYLFLSYVTKLVDFFSSFSFSSVEFGFFIWPIFISYYLGLGMLVLYIQYKKTS